ncbi:hypothetical protein GCM10009678_33700 [Actinomadura kijaniata]
MPPRPRRLDPAVPVERFALELRELHRDAGKPKQQLLAAAMHCSHATVSAILNGHRFPSWFQTEAFVRACRGDVDAWRYKWTETDREINADLPVPGAGDVPATSRSAVRHLTGREFYLALAAEVRRTEHRILTTYIRTTPPHYFAGFTDQETGRAANEYFNAIPSWVTLSESRSVRRLVCLPNAEMLDWGQEVRRQTQKIPGYEVRVLDWQINADPVNIAIFDDTSVFLAFDAGASPRMGGFRIDDQEFARGAIGYFSRLWSSGIRLADHLASLSG